MRDLYRTFATVFATKMTDQLLLYLVQNDPHPTGEARVNGALSATNGFYTATASSPVTACMSNRRSASICGKIFVARGSWLVARG